MAIFQTFMSPPLFPIRLTYWNRRALVGSSRAARRAGMRAARTDSMSPKMKPTPSSSGSIPREGCPDGEGSEALRVRAHVQAVGDQEEIQQGPEPDAEEGACQSEGQAFQREQPQDVA